MLPQHDGEKGWLAQVASVHGALLGGVMCSNDMERVS